jgi:hypothetical protein
MWTRLSNTAWRSVLLSFAFAAFAQPAAAQGIARTFDQLQLLVRPGDTVSVTDDSGRETTGRIADLTATSLVFDQNGQQRQWREQDVVRIRQRRSDSLSNGALIGLAVGAGFGVAIVAADWDADADNEAGLAALAIALYGGIGAGIGVGVDAMIQKRQVIFERRSAPPAQISLVPILSATRKGALVSVRF